MKPEEFKKLWEADEKGSGITFDDIADRAKEWCLFENPKCCDINIVRYAVLKAARVNDAEDYNPNPNSNKTMIGIDEACEWLRNNWRKYINIDADGVVCFGHWENDFRKAMKGE